MTNWGYGLFFSLSGDVLQNLGRLEDAIASYDNAIQFKPDYHEAWNNRGNALYNLGRLEDAIASYDNAIQFKPDYHEAWYNRGNALRNLGRLEDAIASYDNAIQFKPDYHEAWYNRGNALRNLGRLEDAIASYDNAIQFKPDYHEAWYNRGNALRNLGRLEDAIASYDNAIQFKPDYHEAWYNRGNALRNLGRLEDAIASYDNAIQFKPDYHEAWNNRGNALRNLGRLEDAIASYDNAIQFKPDYHEAWYNRGNALSDLGRLEDAIASYDNAIQFKPDLHEAWYNRGLALSDLGRLEDAIASYDNAIQFKPDYHEAWYNRGIALYNLGRLEDAIASYDNAIQFKPDFHQAWNNRGIALYNLGRLEDAIASYDNAIQFKPDLHEAWYNRGLALSDLGRLEDAIASYDNAIQFKPDFHQAWYNRGIALYNLGRLEDAIASYDNAIQFKPDFHQAWNNRGIALYNLGRLEDAIASYDNAIQFKPDLHQAWNNRGLALYNLGRLEDAIASYDNAIQFKPDDHPALINKGNALVKLERYTEAIESYDLALDSIDPQWWEDWNKNQDLANIAEDSKAAVTMSDSINRLHPQTPKVQESGGESDSKKSERLQDYIMQQPRLFPGLSLAKKSYEEALNFLTFEKFPEQHLLVFQELLKVYSRDDAEEFDKKLTQGTQQLEELLSKQELEIEKIRLSSKFAAFNQMRVDILAQSDTIANYIKALEKAEVRKNTCLAWLREGSDYQPHTDFNFQQTQKLLNPKTAAIYWHLSPLAITTFIIKHNEPLKVLQPQLPTELQQKNADAHFVQIQRFVTWVQQWKKSYQHYCQGDYTDKKTTPWRLNMETMLQILSDILEIKQIEHSLQDVDNLILIPHRELHLLPLDHLFATRFIITYVPSFQIGLELLELASSRQNLDSIKLLNVEIPSNNLPFAKVQSAVLDYLYPKCGKLVESPTTKIDLLKALQDCEGYFQFTGHAYHKPEKPRESALLLEKADELTLGDIFKCEELDLGKYQLICLSACETGITSQETSKERIVDEYVGLVSGFLAKKANYVVSTLWRVDDRSTAILIIKFYQLLKQKESPVAALKQAKNWLSELTYQNLADWYGDLAEKLNESHWKAYMETEAQKIEAQKIQRNFKPDERPYAHPYYYAGFIITGKPA